FLQNNNNKVFVLKKKIFKNLKNKNYPFYLFVKKKNNFHYNIKKKFSKNIFGTQKSFVIQCSDIGFFHHMKKKQKKTLLNIIIFASPQKRIFIEKKLLLLEKKNIKKIYLNILIYMFYHIFKKSLHSLFICIIYCQTSYFVQIRYTIKKLI
ncbi:hypothetical protein RFI_32003, partial [Reticulomyxa filosa]